MKKTLFFPFLFGSIKIAQSQDEEKNVRSDGQLLIPNIDKTESIDTGMYLLKIDKFYYYNPYF